MPRVTYPFGRRGWTPARIGRLDGRTFAVTGANGGLGLELSQALAQRGARVIMLCRDPAKAEAAAAQVRATSTGVGPTLIQLDLADLGQIRAAGAQLQSTADKLDGFVANAGIMATPRRLLTKDGFEQQIGVNHFGHFLLASLAAPAVLAAGGRFVAVSSIAHRMGLKRIKFEDLSFAHGYGAITAYCQSKLANLLFTLELHRRLEQANSNAKAIAAHPGYSATHLQFSAPGPIAQAVLGVANPMFAQSAEHGSWPLLLAAADADAQAGAFYGPTKMMETKGAIGQCAPAPWAQDAEAAQRLWRLSEDATGAVWPI